MVLVIGKKYRVKTPTQLINSGWKKDRGNYWSVPSEYGTFNMNSDMLKYEIVTIERASITLGQFDIVEDNGYHYWTAEMLVEYTPTRNLPDWF